MLRDFWHVTKPGMVLGNLVPVMGSFFLASRGHVDVALFLSTTIGISLLIASACVLNNWMDRDLDRIMARTRDRVLAAGLMSTNAAFLYTSVLGLAGLLLLLEMDNLLSVAILLAGFLIYVCVYSLYWKRHSVYAPLIGSLAGAAPPLAAYCAVTGRFDAGAVILLMIFGLWQIPHFYAIAIYRLDDYTAAAIPVLPVKHGVPATNRQIIGFIAAFILATMMLTFGGYTGYNFLAAAIVSGLVWLTVAWKAYNSCGERNWARNLFVCSIMINFTLCVMMSIDYTMPAV
ncbi:MAG: heme o synthase [Gallionella sp.]